ncbi:MAG TPA: GEVED domain-containing protein [Saprospiraceae bacterium]|nr:GEVED domain-containing protein [Saprospiraceae bacterium]
MMTRMTLMWLLLCLSGISFAQKAVYHEVEQLIQQGRSFREVKALTYATSDIQQRGDQLEGLTKGTILNLDQKMLQQLSEGNSDFIVLQVPVSDRASLKLDLVRHQIFSEDFAVISSETGQAIQYQPGLHYKGVVEGIPNSLVAISIFDNQIMGFIALDHQNLVLGPIQNDRNNQHILYDDQDLPKKPMFECSTPDNGIGYTDDELNYHAQSRDVGDCVRVYIEIDNDIVVQKGGVAPATSYITGLFNQAIVLYNNESVNMMINEIYAWATTSPYSGSSSSAMLTSFQNNTGEFNGNVGILVSYQASGGIAVLDGLCQTNPDWRKCFASIDATYVSVPTYSWSVMVVTHEMGHVVGSKHTHACAWNGNNTAIDGCAGSTEGGCPLPGIPPEGGTIMSYCHLTNVGINFNLGFGPQPGNVIRSKVNVTNNCLTSCGPPPPPPPPSYCSSAGVSTQYEWINKVVLNTINNTSGNNSGYHDYTAISTNLLAGSTYTINLTPGYLSSAFPEYWRVWIDYNNDLDFNDAGEQVGQGSGSTAINISFTIPAGTASGSKRMRVSMKYSAFATQCETFNYGEVEDYSVMIGTGSGPSCNDGIQNQGETGVDCGGPCIACATCSDGIQNQGETGIDCGGPCPACPPPPPPGGGVLLGSFFETGWDGWIDGGADATRVSSSFSYEGHYSIRLADNSGTQSAMTSPTFNLSNATGLQIQFYFYAYSMELGEDFWVRYNNGTGWVTVGQYIRGVNFNNNTFYVTTVNIPGFVPTNSGTLRIQCDASDNNDQVYIDQVTISSTTGPALPEANMEIHEVAKADPGPSLEPDENKLDPVLTVFPNPVHDVLHVNFNETIDAFHILSIEGQEMKVPAITPDGRQLDIQSLAPGIYFLYIESGGSRHTVRFSRM